MINIPSAVKIGGLTYTVTETQNITLGSDYNGEILYRELQINIRPMARAQQESTTPRLKAGVSAAGSG